MGFINYGIRDKFRNRNKWIPHIYEQIGYKKSEVQGKRLTDPIYYFLPFVTRENFIDTDELVKRWIDEPYSQPDPF